MMFEPSQDQDKVCQRLAAGQWFSLGTPVSSTNKSDHHHITEILLKVAFNTITLTLKLNNGHPKFKTNRYKYIIIRIRNKNLGTVYRFISVK